MNISTLIHVKAGHVCPRDLIDVTLRNCPTASGFAVRDETGIQFEYFDKTTTTDNVMKLVDFTKDHELFMFFCKWAIDSNGKLQGDLTKDIQPFVLVTGDGDERVTQVAYFAEGDFNKYSDPATGRTDEGNLTSALIDPILVDIFETVEGDPAKFSAKLHSPLIETQLKATIGFRGCFAILPPLGDPILFGQNELGGEFEWGNTTNLWGFGTPKKENAPITNAIAAVKTAKNKFSSFLSGTTEPAKKAEPSPEAPHPDAAPKPELPKEVTAPAKTDTKITAPDGMVAIRVPQKLEGSARNLWLRLMSPNGELPKNHQVKDCVLLVPAEIAVYAKKDGVVTKAHVQAMETEVRAVWAKAKGKSPAATPAVTPTSDFLPGMTDAEMSEATTLLASWMDRDPAKRPTPLQIQEAEAKWPVFSEKLGIPLQDIMFWPVADIMALCSEPKRAAMLIIQLRREYAKHLDIKALVNTATAKVEKPVASGQPPIVPKEVPAQQSKTASKANFLGLKKAS